MYCNKCGKENNDNNNYCNYCGEELKKNVSQVENITNNSNINKEKLNIKQDEVSSYIPIILTVIMVIAGLWLLFMEEDIFNSNLLNFIIKIVAILAVIFFGYGMIFFINRKLENKDIVVVDKNGITDNSTAISLGFIPWKDIDNIYMNSMMSNKFILIKLKNEEEYLNKTSTIKRRLMLKNKNMGYEMICINLNFTGIQPESFLQEILEYRKSLEIKQ